MKLVTILNYTILMEAMEANESNMSLLRPQSVDTSLIV